MLKFKVKKPITRKDSSWCYYKEDMDKLQKEYDKTVAKTKTESEVK